MQVQGSVTGRKAIIPFNERISCTIGEACLASGLGDTSIRELIKTKALKSQKVKGRRLVIVASLRQIIEGETGQQIAA